MDLWKSLITGLFLEINYLFGDWKSTHALQVNPKAERERGFTERERTSSYFLRILLVLFTYNPSFSLRLKMNYKVDWPTQLRDLPAGSSPHQTDKYRGMFLRFLSLNVHFLITKKNTYLQ